MLTITDKIKLPPLPPHPNIAHEGGFHLHPDCQFTVLYKWAKDYARAAVEADRQSRPAASAEPRPDYSEMSREALERHAASMAQALADDKPRAFWERYAIGPKSAPSCICCGRIPDDVAVQHAEIPSIVVCRCCHDAATAPVAQEPYAHEYGRSNGDGTFSVVIERGQPRQPVEDWPVKPLYAAPVAAQPDIQGAAFLKHVIDLCRRTGASPARIEEFDPDEKWIADLWREAKIRLEIVSHQ